MSSFVRVNRRVGKRPTSLTDQNPTTSATSQLPPSQPTSSQSLTQPVQISQDVRQQQRALKKLADATQTTFPNGCKPWIAGQLLTSIGIKDLDALFGGGIPISTVHSIATDCHSGGADIFSNAYLWEGHARKQHIIHVSNMSPLEARGHAQNTLKMTFDAHQQMLAEKQQDDEDNNNTIDNNNNNNNNNTTTTNNINNNEKQKNRRGRQIREKNTSKPSGIDDEDELDLLQAKPSHIRTKETESEQPLKITQGSIAQALNNDEGNAKLTIAWQYDKYRNKVADDSNLSGVSDKDLDELVPESDSDNDNDDDTEVVDNDTTNNNISSTNTNHHISKTIHNIPFSLPYGPLANQTISDSLQILHQQYLYSVITPQTTYIDHQYHPSQPFRNIYNQIKTILYSSNHSSSLLTTSTDIVPCRICVDITPDLIALSQTPQLSSFQQFPQFIMESNKSSSSTSISTSQTTIVQDMTLVEFIYKLYALVVQTNTIKQLNNTESTQSPAILYFILRPTALSPSLIQLFTSLSHSFITMSSFSSQKVMTSLLSSSTQTAAAALLFDDKFDGVFTIHKFPRLNTTSYSYKLPDSTIFLYRHKRQLTLSPLGIKTKSHAKGIATLGLAKLVLPPEITRTGATHTNQQISGGQDLFNEAMESMTIAAIEEKLDVTQQQEVEKIKQEQINQQQQQQQQQQQVKLPLITPLPVNNPLSINNTPSPLKPSLGLLRSKLTAQNAQNDAIAESGEEDEDEE